MISRELEMWQHFTTASIQCQIIHPLQGFESLNRQLAVEHCDKAQGWLRYLHSIDGDLNLDFIISDDKKIRQVYRPEWNQRASLTRIDFLKKLLESVIPKVDGLTDWYIKEYHKAHQMHDTQIASAISRIMDTNRVLDLEDTLANLKQMEDDSDVDILDQHFSKVDIYASLSAPKGQCPLGFQ